MYPWIHFQCIRGYIFDTKAWKSPSSSGCAAVVPAQRPTPGDYDHQNRTSPVVICRDELCARTSDLGPERTNVSTAPTRIGEALFFLQQKVWL